MKRFLLVSILLLITISGASALSYEPSISLCVGVRGTQLVEPYLRTSTLVTVDTELPTITIGNKSRLSIPIGVTFNSRTKEFRGLSLYGYMECYTGLSYEHKITNCFSVGSTLKGIYRYYGKIDASLMGGSISIDLSFIPNAYLTLIMPMELSFLKGELDYTISIGTKFIFGGRK